MAEFETLGAYLQTLSADQLEVFHQAQRVWPIPGLPRCCDRGDGAVWLGPHAATFPAGLARCGITHVLCLTQEGPRPGLAAEVRELRHVPLDDDPDEDLLSALEDCVAWIRQAVCDGGQVLCQCRAGRSRSAAVAAAFVMQAEGCSFEAALESIRSSRPFVNINVGFLRQLKAFATTARARLPRSRLVVGDACPTTPCELCELKQVTQWFEETDRYIVLICDQCDNPMVVWRQHTMLLASEEREVLRKALARHADSFLGAGNWYLDTRQRTILDHVHWHAREHTGLTRLLAKKNMLEDSSAKNETSAKDVISDRNHIGSCIARL
eukprot:TRINITY_DN25977_c0_g1_i1.p1 TRINITY_DN25977_c0_g1~~TRINITY_DN25977_c0_g1_i1.p1  ORF type:complete len:324 (-),score=61.99 TRINITY_DN25977_c0_g1_i1:55-1026(-)